MESKNPQRKNKFLIASGVIAVMAAILGGWLYAGLFLHVAFANDQTQIFEDMRSRALAGSAPQAASFLRYVVTYYPTGTKQASGTMVDRIVERARAGAIREIIADLRGKTGMDLGSSPEPWIQRLAPDGTE